MNISVRVPGNSDLHKDLNSNLYRRRQLMNGNEDSGPNMLFNWNLFRNVLVKSDIVVEIKCKSEVQSIERLLQAETFIQS